MVSTRAHLRARPRVRVCDSPALSQLVAAQSAGRDDSFALTTDGHFYFGGLRNERRHHLERGTTATGMRVLVPFLVFFFFLGGMDPHADLRG